MQTLRLPRLRSLFSLFHLPVLNAAEKTALMALAAVLGSGAVLMAWERSGVEIGPIRDWESLREKVVRAKAAMPDSAFPCDDARPYAGAGRWPERPGSAPGDGEPAPPLEGQALMGEGIAGAAAEAESTASGAISAARGRKTAGKPQEIVDINAADAKTLESLPGVGPATAKAIWAHRSSAGPFRKPESLLRVKGIGPKKLAAMRPFIRLGKAEAAAAESPPIAKNALEP